MGLVHRPQVISTMGGPALVPNHLRPRPTGYVRASSSDPYTRSLDLCDGTEINPASPEVVEIQNAHGPPEGRKKAGGGLPLEGEYLGEGG